MLSGIEIPLDWRAWHGERAAIELSGDVRDPGDRDRRVLPPAVDGYPGPEHAPGRAAHLAERGDLGTDRLPAVGLGDDPDPGAGRRHLRPEVGLRRHAGRPRARLGAGRRC